MSSYIYSSLLILVNSTNTHTGTMPGLAFFNTHRENLERLLFLYSKLNAGISYVQGMNELLAPLYYVLAHDPSLNQDFPKSKEKRERAAEADTFWCFQALMTHVSELYVDVLRNHSLNHSNTFTHSNTYLQVHTRTRYGMRWNLGMYQTFREHALKFGCGTRNPFSTSGCSK